MSSLKVYHDKGSGLAWQTVESPYVYESGQWKHCHTVSIYQNGQWNEVHKSAIGRYSAQTAQNFTSVGTHSYTVPQGTRYLEITVQGAGGGGGASAGIFYHAANCSNRYGRAIAKAAGGDGGLARKIIVTIEVVPTQTFTITVGQGGASGGAGVTKNILAPGQSHSPGISVSANPPYDSNYFSASSGGNGGVTKVYSSLGEIHITANGANNGEGRRGRIASQTLYACTNPADFLYTGSPSLDQGASGSNGTATILGNDVSLASISSLVTTNTTVSGTGGSGGGTGDYRVLPNNSPTGSLGSASGGSNGSVSIVPYSV